MDKLPSPCISICQMDPVSEMCLGCYRTRQEIASWSRMDMAEQKNLVAELQDRRAAATGRARRPRRRLKAS